MSADTPSSSTAASRGVYLLGNDRVIGFLRPLITSLRRHSPGLPARLIPYNDALTETRALCRDHNVQIHEDEAFPALEHIGQSLWDSSSYPNHPKLFRRLAAFWGPYQNFMYLDADVCVLAPLEPMFDVFEKTNAQFASFDNDHERVYNPGPLRERMIREHGSVGFNSGHFLSRRGAFNLQQFQAAAAEARKHSEEFQDRGDQGFLNFAVDWLRVPQVRLPELVPDLADKQWGDQRLRYSSGAWRLNDPSNPSHGKRLVVIHWSGHGQPGWNLPNRGIYYSYLLSGKPLKERIAVKAQAIKTHYWKRFSPAWYACRIKLGQVRVALTSRLRGNAGS